MSAPLTPHELNPILELLLAVLVVVGAVFTALGSFGLVRLKDFYSRLHSPTKATTLGVGSLLIASAIYFSVDSDGPSVHEILVAVFLFITAPVGAHLMAKAALHLRTRSRSPLPPEGLLSGGEGAQDQDARAGRGEGDGPTR
jgi:multicomponent K+:H+ antiporter subunit G